MSSSVRASQRITQSPATRSGFDTSADRFVNRATSSGLTDLERTALLGRFGVFGIRYGISVIAAGEVTTANELARALVATSGLDDLRASVDA